jgi:hypothetical protein
MIRFAPLTSRSAAMSVKREQWTKRMRAWERSGQTRAAFCRSRGLNVHTFDYWRRALRSASTALVPVVVSKEVAPSVVDAVIEVMLPDGIRLRVPRGSEAQVGAIVSALRAC